MQKNTEHIKNLIETKQKRLQKLELQEANKGTSTEPHILTEIDDLRVEISALEKELTFTGSSNLTRGVKQYGWVLALIGLILLIIAVVVIFWDRGSDVGVSQVDTPTATKASTPTITSTLTLTPLPTATSVPTSTPTPVLLPSSPDALIYSFEKDIPSDWSIGEGEGSIGSSEEQSFEGRRALAVDVQLAERSDSQETEGTVQLTLKGRDLQNKMIIARVYAPEKAPTNLFAGLFISDANNEWRSGGGTSLLPGQWTTLTWSTQDAFRWEAPAELGIQFTLVPGSETTDQRAYDGQIFVDLVELLTPSPDISPSLDRILAPLLFYDFETRTIAKNISEDRNTVGIEITEEYHFANGNNSLKVNLNLPPYDYDQAEGDGGIQVDLEKSTPLIDALGVRVLVPEQDNTRSGNFQVSFLATDEDNGLVFSGGLPLQVGEWTPYFWGTRYIFSSEHACEDDNQNGQCDDYEDATEEDPKTYIWHPWKDTKIKGFSVRIWRDDEPYTGPVYIDNLGVYQVKQ